MKTFLREFRNAIKHLGIAFVLFLIVKVIWVWAMKIDGTKLAQDSVKEDILARRAYLMDRVVRQNKLGALSNDEWAIGTYSMLGSALVNIAMLYPETRAESLAAVQSLIDRMLNDEDIRKYETWMWRREDALQSLEGPNGHLGYLGHLNLLLAYYHYLGGQNHQYRTLFEKISHSMTHKIASTKIGQAETYPGMVFIADNVAAVASIAMYENLFQAPSPRFSQQWLKKTQALCIDPDTGLLVHTLFTTGRFMDWTRGCTIGWNSFYLPFIDPGFARQQFNAAKQKLISKTSLGFTGLREFPQGAEEEGDGDSGPVLFGLSTSGTGFIVAGAKLYKDTALLNSLMITAETAGFTFQWNGQRRYLLAPMVGDAIMLTMMTATPWGNKFSGPNS